MLDHQVDKLRQVRTINDLFPPAFSLRDEWDVNHVVYHWVNSSGDQFGAGTYPRSWADLYEAQGYLRVDPVVQGCFAKFHPVDWKTLDWSSKAARRLREEALEHGLGEQGYSVPIRGPLGQFAVFTVNDSRDDADWSAFIESHRQDLLLMAYTFNEAALRIGERADSAAAPSLSPREVDALTFLALGLSRAQAADRLKISEHTLRVYVESARFKLGAGNTTQAVARALALGLIVI